MRNGLTKFLCGFSLTLLVSFGQSNAATIVSNLTDAVDGTGTIYASGPPQSYAQEFTTGSTSVALGSVIAVLGNAAPTFTASAELVANTGTLPGSTVLTSFTVPSIPTSSPVSLTFAPTSSVTLSANTDYWFVLSASGTGSYQWNYTDTLSASLPNYAVSQDSGATWTIGTPAGPFLIEVDSAAASSVPEPSSLVLVGFAGLLAILGIFGRKFRVS